jgi:imidazolonepropionase-like amidohydrolase
MNRKQMSAERGARLAIVGGTVITREQAIENGIILIEDGRIAFVGHSLEAEPEPASEIIDASGQLVLPGLIDTHVHGSHGDDVMFIFAEHSLRIT